MKFKKFIFTLLIVFSLSFSFQPVNFLQKEKDAIVFVYEFGENDFLTDFTKRNEAKRFSQFVSLTLKCLMIENCIPIFNTA